MSRHEYPDHPVPPRATVVEGDRPMDALNTGHDIAQELARPLLPHAREALGVQS